MSTEHKEDGSVVTTTTTYTTHTSHSTPKRVTETHSLGVDGDSVASPGPETHAQDETIEKLRLANQALRQQLKEFSRALDASLAHNGPDASPGGRRGTSDTAAQGKRRNMLAALSAKEKQLKAVHKKLEIYKRANVELKKQLGSVYHPEKLQQLKSEKAEKERIIEELQSENRSLLIVQRNQTKTIEEQENLKHEWPAKVSSLMADLRVAKEKLRKAKERETRVEHDSRKLHEQMVRLQEKNKKLQSQLAQYEKHSNGHAGDRQKRKMMHNWKEEKAKLEHSIQVLERSKHQERTKGERLLRANMAELQKVKKEMERHKQQLDEKIAAVHSWCIGGGVDVITACDIRFASADAKFSVREAKAGVVADLGTLQRLPAIVGEGNARNLALRAHDIDADEALRIGLVSKVLPTHEETLAYATAAAADIAGHPREAVVGTKQVLNFGRGKPVKDGLEYVATWNAAHLDVQAMAEAFMKAQGGSK